MKIEALHDFHNTTYATEWANRFDPSPERLRLFATIYERICHSNFAEGRIVELGTGPGYLAQFLLTRLPKIKYTGIDFSKAMIAIAERRLMNFGHDIRLIQGDLVTGDWLTTISPLPDVIISTWTLHDLCSDKLIANVYQHSYQVLRTDGILLNGDFIKPSETIYDYEAGRIELKEHLKFLEQAGFSSYECLDLFESDKNEPTTANNYALFEARK